jgi:hypothetical protein
MRVDAMHLPGREYGASSEKWRFWPDPLRLRFTQITSAERERESAPAWPLEQSSPMHSLVTQTEVSGSAGPGDPLESSIPLAARVARAQEVPIHCVQPCTRGEHFSGRAGFGPGRKKFLLFRVEKSCL